MLEYRDKEDRNYTGIKFNAKCKIKVFQLYYNPVRIIL